MYYVFDPNENKNITEEVKTEEQGNQVEKFDTDNINVGPILNWIDEWDNCHGDLILF
jgi:hypothetical protein